MFGSAGAPQLGISFRVDDLEEGELERMRAMLEIAEEICISRIAIGDSQWAHFDAVIIATLMGELTSRALIGIKLSALRLISFKNAVYSIWILLKASSL